MIGREDALAYAKPALLLPLGFTNATPADRRQLAMLTAGLAALTFVLSIRLPFAVADLVGDARWLDGFAATMAAIGGITLVAGMLAAAWQWIRAGNAYYPGPGAALTDAWEIVPGDRIGPLALGPLGADVVTLLRGRAGFVYIDLTTVVCTLPHWQGETLVTVRTAEPPHDDRRPDPLAFMEIVIVSTTSPIHPLAGSGVRVGMSMPDALGLMGLPDAITPPADHPARRRALEYRGGLALAVRGNEVRAIAIRTAAAPEA